MSSQYPAEPTDIFDVFDNAMRSSFKVLKASIALIILITLAQGVIVYLGSISHSFTLNTIFEVIGGIIFLFFGCAMLYQANTVLQDKPISYQTAIQAMLPRIFKFYITLVVSLFIVFAYYVLAAYLMHLWGGTPSAHSSHTTRSLIFALVGLVPIIVCIGFYIFTFPLIILDDLPPLKAFAQSYRLVRARWLHSFTVYVAIGIVLLLVLPGTRHAMFFRRHHVLLLFDFVVFCILLPFLVNYVLFMLNDMKVRWQLDQE
ncbi:MAG: hypothetical protein COB66_03150 [Coxiella sp. (in: Bacteria)]|nr:MAG: hypothetical protein COB66_03150 [Coxiella sp. (in: g-proteobacteria)]